MRFIHSLWLESGEGYGTGYGALGQIFGASTGVLRHTESVERSVLQTVQQQNNLIYNIPENEDIFHSNLVN